mgnify:CR=1 FL=1
MTLSGLSSDKDGLILKEGFYIYDLNGKLIKSFDSKNATLDLINGKYQIITYAIDDKGEKSYKSEYITINNDVQTSSGDILDNTQTTSLKANSDYTVYAKYEIKF